MPDDGTTAVFHIMKCTYPQGYLQGCTYVINTVIHRFYPALSTGNCHCIYRLGDNCPLIQGQAYDPPRNNPVDNVVTFVVYVRTPRANSPTLDSGIVYVP